MYNVKNKIGEKNKAQNYLENSYLQLKTRSQNIKNKTDRNKYMNVELHKEIISAWKN